MNDTSTSSTSPSRTGRVLLWTLVVLVLALGALGGVLFTRMLATEQQLAGQMTQATTASTEARTLAQQFQERERDLSARQAVLEAKLGETVMQRAQLDELVQGLTRARDDALVLELESLLRVARQRADLSGSVQPLLTALRVAEQRLQRVNQARLAPVQRAVAADVARIQAAPGMDTPAALAKLGELLQGAGQLRLANAALEGGAQQAAAPAAGQENEQELAWWQRLWRSVKDSLSGLVRVSRITSPEAALLAPEQAWFLRENYKLYLQAAGLDLRARLPEAARTDLLQAVGLLDKYFDSQDGAVQRAMQSLQEIRAQLLTPEMPGADATLAALAALAGR